MPEFTTRWFKSGDRAMWLEHLGYLRDRPTRYLEIGVYEGRSLCWVLDKLLLHPGSYACGVDPWDQIVEAPDTPPQEIYARAIANILSYGHKVDLYRARSASYMASDIECGVKYDLIYIDGSHRLPHVWVDTGLAWQVLREGGVLVWDDYKRGTRRMVNLFVRLVGARAVWSTKRQLAVRKGDQP